MLEYFKTFTLYHQKSAPKINPNLRNCKIVSEIKNKVNKKPKAATLTLMGGKNNRLLGRFFGRTAGIQDCKLTECAVTNKKIILYFCYMNIPLAERIRPKKLEDYISQQHLVGKNGALTRQIESGIIPSMLFWGTPGTGKTTLAQIIAQTSNRPFYCLSAINSGVKDVRDIIEKAQKNGGIFTTKNPILFIDEIHRFSKSQQDSLLGAVEKGIVTLIGATTENPSFEVIPALLSRCQVYKIGRAHV